MCATNAPGSCLKFLFLVLFVAALSDHVTPPTALVYSTSGNCFFRFFNSEPILTPLFTNVHVRCLLCMIHEATRWRCAGSSSRGSRHTHLLYGLYVLCIGPVANIYILMQSCMSLHVNIGKTDHIKDSREGWRAKKSNYLVESRCIKFSPTSQLFSFVLQWAHTYVTVDHAEVCTYSYQDPACF